MGNIEIVGADRDTLARKIRDRAETHLIDTDDPKIGDGNPDWSDFRRYIINDIIEGGSGKDSERIENTLDQTKIRPIDQRQWDDEEEEHNTKKIEEWYSAQLYGALYNEFDSPNNARSGLRSTNYEVYREHERWGLNVDLYVRNERNGSFFLIEAKRAEIVDKIERITDQLKRYNAIFPDSEAIFLCLLYNDFSELEELEKRSLNGDEAGSQGDTLTYISDRIGEELNKSIVVGSKIDPDPP
jgi:hypothetical protein